MRSSRGVNVPKGSAADDVTGDRTPGSSRGGGVGGGGGGGFTPPLADGKGSINLVHSASSSDAGSSLGEQLRQPRRVRRHSSSSSHGSTHGSSGLSGMAVLEAAGARAISGTIMGVKRSGNGQWTSLDDDTSTRTAAAEEGAGGAGGAEKLQAGIPRFKQWKGNNKFFCGGRVMLGVHWRQLFITAALIWISWALYFIIIYPDIDQWPYAFVACFLFFGSMVTLVTSSLTDPGIIPRRPFNRLVDSMPADMKDQLNYCSTCHVLRPPRAKHCRHCNNCVLRFDHHCPWTGNCVGRRNYRSFFAFLLFTQASASFVLILSVFDITTKLANAGPEGLTDADGLRGSKYAAPVLACWTLLVVMLVGAMCGFHTFLLFRGQTTNEFLRGEHRRGGIPHKPFLQNCWAMWCDGIPETQLPLMHLAQDENDRKADDEYAAELASSMKARQLSSAKSSSGGASGGGGEGCEMTQPTASAASATASSSSTTSNTTTSIAIPPTSSKSVSYPSTAVMV